MTKRLFLNILSIFLLLGCYFSLWVFNQRINYRKVLTLNTKVTLNTNSLTSSELSSPTYILRYLIKQKVSADLLAETVLSPEMVAMGREITTKYGNLVVFEYENSNDASRQVKLIQSNPMLASRFGQLQAYKNLVIYYKGNAKEVEVLLEYLNHENK